MHSLEIVADTHQSELTLDLFKASEEKLAVPEVVLQVPEEGLDSSEPFEVFLTTRFSM
ncbi:unnamed protein product [marine sediment metagenome]|uniref:Uncharacterized protein n=1 Tax=marine sediment metagenome TaxID=412755 RepID=X0RZK0_9ZZZZ